MYCSRLNRSGPSGGALRHEDEERRGGRGEEGSHVGGRTYASSCAIRLDGDEAWSGEKKRSSRR